MGEIAILDKTGDTKIEWNINSEEATAEAKKKFDEYKKKGYMFFYVDGDGKQKGEIDVFDPLAEMLICVPKVRKG